MDIWIISLVGLRIIVRLRNENTFTYFVKKECINLIEMGEVSATIIRCDSIIIRKKIFLRYYFIKWLEKHSDDTPKDRYAKAGPSNG